MVSNCVDLKSVYRIIVGKFVLTSVSAKCLLFQFLCLKGCILQFHISDLNIKGSPYCLGCKNGIF